ncbi:MAG: hypothetical protein KAW12_31105, partial [Candidatus Aminicenantes bacterium]|nr:hypothetical protein [Candidatus Aminicenantes bacterium]
KWGRCVQTCIVVNVVIKPEFTTKIATSLMGSGFPKKLLDVIQNKLFFCESGQKFVLFGTRRVIFRADFPK